MPGISVTQLAHVCIFTHDLKASERFYREALGLEIIFNFSRKGEWHGFYIKAGGNTFVEVFEKPGTSFSDKNAINHFCFAVKNLDEAIVHIRAQGVTITDKSFGCDDTWQAWTADPDGVKIELFEYTDKSAQFVGGDRVATW